MQLLIKPLRLFSLALCLVLSTQLMGQGNCQSLTAGTKERIACEYGKRAIAYKQGSRQSLLLFDSALVANPDYAWAYYEKSITFLKRGYLSKGMSILNKAVALEPLDYLTYRAYWFFQHHSYERCQQDLERYYALEGAYEQNTPGGALSMRIVLALTYAHQEQYDKAISLVNEVIQSYPSEDYAGPYDFHCLGVLYYKNKQYGEAEEALQKSIKRNAQFADTYYYLAMLAQQAGTLDQAKALMEEALLRYDGKKDGYTGYPFCFPVYKEQAVAQVKQWE